MKSVLWLMAWLMLSLATPAFGATVEYLHTDALGSVVAVSNSVGTVIERREYEPYGRQLVPTVPDDGPAYTGHVSDAATGLSYMQQRYYDPAIGRFLSVDPVTAYEQPGSNFNRYWYANNNPYIFTDPDGRRSYLVSRLLQGDLGKHANHNFIVHHAEKPGDPNGVVRSYGDTGNDTMGEVTKDTKGFSEGTYETDRQAWESLGDAKGSDVTYREIDAYDEVVQANADSLVGGDEYSAVPSVQGGVNSNSAAGSIATRSDGGASSVDNGRRQPGSESSAVDRVKFTEEPRK